MRRWLQVVLVLGATGAVAHDADVLFATIQAGEGPLELIETVTMTSATLSLLTPVDLDGDHFVTPEELAARKGALQAGVWDDMPLAAGGQACVREDSTAAVREGFIELGARFQCTAGELRQDFRFLRVLPTNYRVALSAFGGERQFAQGSFSSVTIPRTASVWARASTIERLGSIAWWLLALSMLAMAARRGRELVLQLVLWCAAFGVLASVAAGGGRGAPVALIVLGSVLVALRPEGALALSIAAAGALGASTPLALPELAGALGVLVLLGTVVGLAAGWARRGESRWKIVRLLPAAVAGVALVMEWQRV